MAKLFQTGDSVNETISNVTLELANNVWFKRALLRALMLMTVEENWQQDGVATVEFARDKANEMYVSIAFDVEPPMTNNLPVGATTIWHMASPPDRWLICDGSGVLKSEYPLLYALIGGKYGESADFFGLPDFTNRSPFGRSFSHELDTQAGSETHTLTIGEIPSHNHTQRIGTAAGANALAVGTTNAANSTVTRDNLNNTGGGGAHNNLHPILAVNFIIYAGEAEA